MKTLSLHQVLCNDSINQGTEECRCHVCGHRNETDGTHCHPGKGQSVVAAVVVQVGGCHDLGCGTEVCLGVFHRYNTINFCKATVGFGCDGDARTTRNIVKHDGGLSCLRNGRKMGVDTRLSRLVVVGSHDQQAVHANLFSTVRQLNSMRGVVRTNTGNNLRARTNGILHNLEDALVLVIGHGGVLTGGTADHQAVVAVLHKVVRQVCNLLFIHGAVLRKGGHHCGQEATEDRFNKSTGVRKVLRHMSRVRPKCRFLLQNA